MLIALCENEINSEALVTVVYELRREASVFRGELNWVFAKPRLKKKTIFLYRELLCAARCITVPQLFVLSRQRVWWSQRFATRASSARISTLSLAVGARAAATDVGALSVYMFLRSSLITVCKSVFAKSLKLFAHRWNPSGFRSNSKPRKYGYVYSN